MRPAWTREVWIRACIVALLCCSIVGGCAAGGGGFQPDGVSFDGNGLSHGHP